MASMLEVKAFFGYASLKAFRTDWEDLTDADKTALRTGIGDGTLNY